MRLDIVFIILLGGFLRLYRIQDFYMFLADQGRDALIVRKIAMLQKFPLIGPPSSIGEVFLGPFYYYLVAPFLWLFRYNPVGLAVGVAVLSILCLIAVSYIVERVMSAQAAFVFTTLLATSALLVDVGRFSWNPNLLPYVTFITLSLFYAMLFGKRKILYGLAFGVMFGLSFQLHHLAALLVIPLALYFVWFGLRRQVNAALIPLGTAIVGFFATLAPFALFELRHNFLNTHNLISLFTKQNLISSGTALGRLTDVITAFVGFALHIPVNALGAYGIVVLIIGAVAYFLRRRMHPFVLLQLIAFVTLLGGLSRVNAQSIPHYFHTVYLSFYFLIAYLLTRAVPQYRLVLIAGFLLLFFAIQFPSYYFLWGAASKQYETPQKVGAFIATRIGQEKVNLATYPVEFTSRDCYQYYIEYYGGHVVDLTDPQITNTMYVLCDKEPCRVLNSHSWNIDQFGKAKIDTMWHVGGIAIYKLKHQ